MGGWTLKRLGGRRLAAYLLDWLLSIIVGGLLLLLAGLILLGASDLDRRDPPNIAIYAAILIITSWLPLWLLLTTVVWSRLGASPGMAVMGIGVVDQQRNRPGAWRACWRAIALTVSSLPLLLAPMLIALAASLGTVGPLYIFLPVLVLVILSLAACAAGLVRKDGRAAHDWASGTSVVRVRGGLTSTVDRHHELRPTAST